jgi:hypothetical protein
MTEQIARFRKPRRADFERLCGVYACSAERWVTFEVGGGEGKYRSTSTAGLCYEHARQAKESLERLEARR